MHIQENSSVGITVPETNQIAVWRIGRLWELAQKLPLQHRALSDFAHILEERTGYWWYEQIPTLREVAERTRRIDQTDLSYPIILAADGRVLDGRHRIAKAWMLNHSTIAVVQFETNPEPDTWLDPATLGLHEGSINTYISGSSYHSS